ncbi:MAG: Ig-like domain-containing protein, partial [Candidatus Aenigmarchaeota archaeon]|nr:Ig-like domain-containing protein [Candidatus Aenigmarchaeota archaeon]
MEKFALTILILPVLILFAGIAYSYPVVITNPSDGTTVSGIVEITTEDAGISTTPTKVEFYVDYILKSTDFHEPYSYSWNTASYSSAAHVISILTYDDTIGRPYGDSVSVTVNNNTGTAPPAPQNLTPEKGHNFSSTTTSVILKWSAIKEAQSYAVRVRDLTDNIT